MVLKMTAGNTCLCGMLVLAALPVLSPSTLFPVADLCSISCSLRVSCRVRNVCAMWLCGFNALGSGAGGCQNIFTEITQVFILNSDFSEKKRTQNLAVHFPGAKMGWVCAR